MDEFVLVAVLSLTNGLTVTLESYPVSEAVCQRNLAPVAQMLEAKPEVKGYTLRCEKVEDERET